MTRGAGWDRVPQDFATGDPILAGRYNRDWGYLAAAIASKWTAFTPTLTNTSGEQGKVDDGTGDGTAVGAYQRLGRLCSGRFRLTFGTAPTFPAGYMLLGFPDGITAWCPRDDQTPLVGHVWMAQGSGTQRTAALYAYPGGLLIWAGAGAYGVTPTTPWTWAATNMIAGVFRYEVDTRA